MDKKTDGGFIPLDTNVSCEWCKHLQEEQDGIPPESRYFWLECDKTSFHNLKSFPFKKTKCKYFDKRDKIFKASINLELQTVLSN